MAQDAENGTHPAIAFIRALFGASTDKPVFFQTLANDKGDVDEARIKSHILTRDPDTVLRFVRKFDRNRRGMFFCVATLEDGSRTRDKTTVRETPCLHVDIDFKNVVETEPEIRAAIAALRLPPTIINFSGGGLHLYWLLKEATATQDNIERIETALLGLAGICAGDPQVCEVARLMRLPGSHNSKYGDLREVVTERLDGPRYELEELEEWIAEARAVLTRKAPAVRAVAAVVRDDPWAAAARDLGIKGKLDVDAEIAGMIAGTHDNGRDIHWTQVRVSASLIKAGMAIDDVVALLLEKTRAAASPEELAKWNWREEEKDLRRMCATALRKFPPPEPAPAEPIESERDDEPEPQAAAHGAAVVNLKAERDRRTRTKSDKIDHVDIGEMFVAGLRAQGQDLMFTAKGAYRYEDGLWRLEDEKGLKAWLDTRLEECVRAVGVKSTTKLVGEARAWVIRHPALQNPEPPFDMHRKVPTRSGLVDPLTGELEPASPQHYCTWRVPFEYSPPAACPHWLQMLEDVFADRAADVRAEIITLLQEMAGMMLVDDRPKALSRAMILQGGSNYGKSGMIDVMAGLFGDRINSTPLDALEGAHGMMSFARRVPWVLHEAFDASKWHMSSVVKAIISGDPIQINVKNGAIFSHRVTAPILWGTNNPPQFKEATRAITNRIAVIECRREFDEDNPVGAALAARTQGLSRPSDLVLATEMPGVLAWAVEGLRRALARGWFALPSEVKAAAEAIRLDSNIVAGFVKDCITFNPDGMVSAADFGAAFASWWLEHKGEDRRIPSGDSVGKALKALGESRIAVDLGLRTKDRRYYAGISLNAEGRRYWSNTVSTDAFAFQSRKASTSAPDDNPNVALPGAWDGRASIKAMHAAHGKSMTLVVTLDEGGSVIGVELRPKGDTSDSSETSVIDQVSPGEPSETTAEPLF